MTKTFYLRYVVLVMSRAPCFSSVRPCGDDRSIRGMDTYGDTAEKGVRRVAVGWRLRIDRLAPMNEEREFQEGDCE